MPTPAIPSFVDGTIVHQADLNALAANLTNLYNFENGGFRTQPDMVIAVQTTGQSIPGTTDTLVNFQTTTVNTNNMWTASVANKITIQTAGIYWIFAQARWPLISGATFPANWAQANILLNGTNATANTVAMSMTPFTTVGSGTASQCGLIANLAAGAVIYLDLFGQYSGSATLPTNFGGTFLGAFYRGPST